MLQNSILYTLGGIESLFFFFISKASLGVVPAFAKAGLLRLPERTGVPVIDVHRFITCGVVDSVVSVDLVPKEALVMRYSWFPLFIRRDGAMSLTISSSSSSDESSSSWLFVDWRREWREEQTVRMSGRWWGSKDQHEVMMSCRSWGRSVGMGRRRSSETI